MLPDSDDWQITKTTGIIVTLGGLFLSAIKLLFGRKETKATENEKLRDDLLERVKKLEADVTVERERCDKKVEELRDKLDAEWTEHHQAMETVRKERDAERDECNRQIDELRQENNELRRRVRSVEADPERLPMAAIPNEGMAMVKQAVLEIQDQATEIQTLIMQSQVRTAALEAKVFGRPYPPQIEEKQ